jgi:hypothetical protein
MASRARLRQLNGNPLGGSRIEYTLLFGILLARIDDQIHEHIVIDATPPTRYT